MRLAAGILIALVAVSACYTPTVPAGAPCDPQLDNCPAGQRCEMTATGAYCGAIASAIDARINDGMHDTAPGCLGVGLVHDVCPMPPLTNDVMIAGDRTINTATVGGGHCDAITAQSGGPSLCMISGRTITIANGARLFGQGPNALVLVANDTITVTGTIDVASRLNQTSSGAGASTNCAGPNGGDASQFEGAGGGGAGGSFATKGGNGGTGRQPNNPNTAGGVAANPQGAPALVVGGCAGGRGGNASGGGGYGVGGAGGGAVYLIAGTSIDITGTINASGSGGGQGAAGTNASGGAGGGGSGGLIGLDAPAITSTGQIFANGGSGGGGGGDQFDRPGQPGVTPTTPLTAAVGGNGGNGGGGDGGNGSVLATPPGNGNNGPNPYCSGGGGGGGAGVIKVYGASPSSLGGMVSPAPT